MFVSLSIDIHYYVWYASIIGVTACFDGVCYLDTGMDVWGRT
jgi:hypothetical protein